MVDNPADRHHRLMTLDVKTHRFPVGFVSNIGPTCSTRRSNNVENMAVIVVPLFLKPTAWISILQWSPAKTGLPLSKLVNEGADVQEIHNAVSINVRFNLVGVSGQQPDEGRDIQEVHHAVEVNIGD